MSNIHTPRRCDHYLCRAVALFRMWDPGSDFERFYCGHHAFAHADAADGIGYRWEPLT